MKNFITKIAFFICLIPVCVQAQFYEDLPVPIIFNGELKTNGFSGGHNVPQFSEADFNNDGLMDLYVFDRNGGVSRTYLQVIENGSPRYQYAPVYMRNFPEMSNWVLLRDYNGDGAVDIFTSAASEGVAGIKVFRGFYNNGQLDFEIVNFYNGFPFNVLTFPLSNGLHTNVQVLNIDYPVVDDIDNDSDLDILSFDGGGSHVIWYRNRSVENGFGMDSLIFRIEDTCWGGFKEGGLEPVITLGDFPGDCSDGQPEGPTNYELDNRHAGSTLLTFDEDGDIDKEILIGDLIDTSLVGLHNAGVLDEAYMNEQDTLFPAYDVPVKINFPAAFYLDVDFDGHKDLIASPNESNNAPNYEIAWYYKNTNVSENPVFEFQQRDFLLETMVDFGTNAYPALVDVTGDGLLDLVVGNTGYTQDNGSLEASLFLFENTGTATNPEFTLIDDDWLSFKQYSSVTNSFQPAFGDLDSDGDLDILVGEDTGWLFYAENTAGAGNPMAFSAVIPHWMDIDVGMLSSPAIADLNEDGKPDLLIGERNKELNYFQNIGTSTEPAFNIDPTMAPNTHFFGQITVTSIIGPITGYGTPRLAPYNDKFRLFVGNEEGQILRYDNVGGGDVTDALLQADNFVGMIDEGRETAVAVADLNDDGFLDMVIGNRRGGLRIVATDLLVNPLSTNDLENAVSFDLYPNPTDNQLFIDLKNVTGKAVSYTLYNAIGVVMQSETITQMNTEITIENLPSGIYFCRIDTGNAFGVQRFVKE